MSNPFEPSSNPGSGGRPVHPLERPAPTYQRPPGPPSSPPQGGQPRGTRIQKEQPILVYVILAINIIVFVADHYFLRSTVIETYNGQQYSVIHYLLTDLGVKDNGLILAGQLWRFITPMFLHGDEIHIAVNSYSLYIMGPQVERTFGRARFTAIYVLSGFAGVIASFAFNDANSLGASGAIFGLVGAQLPLLYRNREIIHDTRGHIMSLVQVIVVNVLIGIVSSRIDNWGHIGGLIGGLALGWFATPLLKVTQDFDGPIRLQDTASGTLVWVAIGVIAAVLVGLAYGVMVLKGGMVVG